MLAFESQQNSQCLKPHDKFEAKAVLLLGAVPTSVAVASELPLNNWRRDGDGWSLKLHGTSWLHVLPCFYECVLVFLVRC